MENETTARVEGTIQPLVGPGDDEITAIINRMPKEEQNRLNVLVKELCSWIEQRGPTGYLAFAMVGLTMQQQAESNAAADLRRKENDGHEEKRG